LEFLYFLPLGIAIGILSGFFGLGGGLLLTPVLLLLGTSPVVAISTSLLFSIGTSVSSVYGHLALKNIIWKAALIIGASGIIGTQFARPLVLYLDEIGVGEIFLSIVYIILLSYFAYSLLRKKKKKERKPVSQKLSIFLYIALGLFGGFMSAALGVGGGFIVVPLLVSMLNFEPRKAVGTSAVCIFMFVSVGFLSYTIDVQIDYVIGGILIVGALIGGQLGAKTTKLFKNEVIQKMLGLLYIVTLLSVLFKLLGLQLVGLITLATYGLILLTMFTLKIYEAKSN
jgi:uncharacterized protein